MDSGISGHTTIQSMSQNDRDSYDYAYSNYWERRIKMLWSKK
jgi:hypothetical protein